MKFIKKLFIVILLLVILICGGITFMGYQMYEEAISKISIEKRIEEIKQDQNYITIDSIAKDFQNAIIAIEDHRFLDHNGIDIITTTRSMIENIKEKQIVARWKYHFSTSWKITLLYTRKTFHSKSSRTFCCF